MDADSKRYFRGKPRLGRKVPVRFQVVENDQPVGGEVTTSTRDVSVGGAFIVAAQPPRPGSRLRVTLTMPPKGRKIELRARVRWVAEAGQDPEPGMGVSFDDVTMEQLQTFDEYFMSLTATVDHDDLE